MSGFSAACLQRQIKKDFVSEMFGVVFFAILSALKMVKMLFHAIHDDLWSLCLGQGNVY